MAVVVPLSTDQTIPVSDRDEPGRGLLEHDMSDGVRVWAVDESDSLKEMKPSKLDYEDRIETWMCENVSVLVPDDSGLLVIGRQVPTIFGGIIDLLCIDEDGDLVIVELKRDKTPREITAQALDYASWVQDLTSQEVEGIAAVYLNGKSLKDAFEDTFVDKEYPRRSSMANTRSKLLRRGSMTVPSESSVIFPAKESLSTLCGSTFSNPRMAKSTW